jgi:predicted dehydrogenase
MRLMAGGAIKVGIMGAGRMAQGYDAPGSQAVHTHAGAILRDSRFVLGGFFDVDPDKASVAEEKWGCAASPRDRNVWLRLGWDVVCIATPTGAHLSDLNDTLGIAPRAIVVEKPLLADPEALAAAFSKAKSFGCAVFVNYSRRFDPVVRTMAKQIKEGWGGRPLFAVCAFSGAATNSASHAIDLLEFFWNFERSDLTKSSGESALLTLDGPTGPCQLALFSDSRLKTYLWEMAVYCENATLRFTGAPEHLILEEAKPYPGFAGYTGRAEVRKVELDASAALLSLWDFVAQSCLGAPDVAVETERSQKFVAQTLGLIGSQ